MADWPKILGGVLVLAAITWAVVEIREDGARSIKDAIERQNNDAASQSDADRSDYDRCLDGGRVWDFGARKCRGVAPGRRD
ncbi:hypothetical protein [Sinorhizobium meliloti]|uniref:hypothetical protein n=1 Tax=Rhizobium meliloti TaxID=382 RepID=UPI000FD38A22|nr:hypothetical protein [Sinorhizobium meliloti]RVN79746.1 hypothetical protein CN101_35035 [Sinorhizobium meliloti]RVO46052.1 hypothetical protein CN094_37645 [Sinorhizobium meliloti]